MPLRRFLPPTALSTGRLTAYRTLVAAVCLLALASHVYTAFERVRFRIVTTPRLAEDAVVAVPLPDLSPLEGTPVAVILRLRGGAEAARVAVAFDRTPPMATLALKPQRGLYVNEAAVLPPAPPAALTLAADRDGWQLEYLEIANVHGHSTGALSFVIVPREGPRGVPLSPWLVVGIGIVLAVGQPRLDWPRSRWARGVHRGAVVLALLFLVAVIASGWITPYTVLIAWQTWTLLVCVLYLEPLSRLARLPLWRSARARLIYRYTPYAGAAVLLASSLAQVYDRETGLTALIRFGETFHRRALPEARRVPHVVHPGAGYDGQFYAQLAVDPLLQSDEIRRAVDSPRYRGRRILLPWVAHVLGLGNPAWVIQAYACLNLVSWVLLGGLLLHWLPPGTPQSAAAWLACMFSHGLLTSVAVAVPDGPSVLLIALGVRAVERGRHALATTIMSLAGLTRETNLLGTAILLPVRPSVHELLVAARRLAIVVVPLAAWTVYLWSLDLPGSYVGARNFALPFWGYVTKGAATLAELTAQGWYSSARLNVLAFVALTTQAVMLLWKVRWESAWWRAGVAYVALMLVLGTAVWEGVPGAATRLLLPMTVAFNVLLLRHRWFWPLWVLGNANLLHGLEVIGAIHVVPGLLWLVSVL